LPRSPPRRPAIRSARTWLAQREVNFTYMLTEGGHEWTNWRNYLADFLPLLFR